eukprot:scaffold291535_cov23-Tisochrysis_lutea.AAC.1
MRRRGGETQGAQGSLANKRPRVRRRHERHSEKTPTKSRKTEHATSEARSERETRDGHSANT